MQIFHKNFWRHTAYIKVLTMWQMEKHTEFAMKYAATRRATDPVLTFSQYKQVSCNVKLFLGKRSRCLFSF